MRRKCFLRSLRDVKVFKRSKIDKFSLSRQNMHWMISHFIKSVFDKLMNEKIEICFSSTLILKRRKSWFFCFLQSTIKIWIAVIRRRNFFSIDNVTKIKSASMIWILLKKTYSVVWRAFCSTTNNFFNCRWISIIDCFFLYFSLICIKRAFSCRRLKLR